MVTLRERYEEVFGWKDEGRGWGIPVDDDEDDCARRGEFKLMAHVNMKDGLSYLTKRSVQILVVIGKLAVKATFGIHLLAERVLTVPLVRFRCKTTNETVDCKLYRLRLSPMTAVLEFWARSPEDSVLSSGGEFEEPLDWESFALCQIDCQFDCDRDDSAEFASPYLINKFEDWVSSDHVIEIEKPHADLIRELEGYCISTLCAVNPCKDEEDSWNYYFKLFKVKGRVMWERFEGTISLFTGWMYDLAVEVPRDVLDELTLLRVVRMAIKEHSKQDNCKVLKKLFRGGEFVDLSGCGSYNDIIHRLSRLPDDERKYVQSPTFVFSNRPEIGKQSKIGQAFVERRETLQPMIVGQESIFPSCRVYFRGTKQALMLPAPEFVPGDASEDLELDPRALVDETGKRVGRNHARNVRQREKRRQRKLKEANSATHVSKPNETTHSSP